MKLRNDNDKSHDYKLYIYTHTYLYCVDQYSELHNQLKHDCIKNQNFISGNKAHAGAMALVPGMSIRTEGYKSL
jgi:hypothetical protein